jgi:putative PIN family toxin of toxin-antitoxin system
MKVLFDTNIWVSALMTRGLCADLLRLMLRRHGNAGFDLLMCEAVRAETLRILSEKFRAMPADLEYATTAMTLAREVAEGEWHAPEDFPDPDDVPIVSAALGGQADWLVTGDKALLALGNIEGMLCLAPRTAYERLAGIQ